MKVKENQPDLNLVDLPTEIQDKIMMNMNCLKDLESMSEATPFLTQIAAEYEKVRFRDGHESLFMSHKSCVINYDSRCMGQRRF